MKRKLKQNRNILKSEVQYVAWDILKFLCFLGAAGLTAFPNSACIYFNQDNWQYNCIPIHTFVGLYPIDTETFNQKYVLQYIAL